MAVMMVEAVPPDMTPEILHAVVDLPMGTILLGSEEAMVLHPR